LYSDFHYYMIHTLANKAGFSHAEAHTIAFASQFIDDNVRYEDMTVINLPTIWYGDCAEGNVFKPVCTAHDDLMMVASGLIPSVEKRTYLPFHFIPETAEGLTRPDGRIARKVVDEAINSLKKAPPSQDIEDRRVRERELIALGIALHSYADTWAHREFTAYHEDKNSVEDFEVKTASGWVEGSSISGSRSPLPVGHGRAGSCPDMSFLEWRYRSPSGMVERNNPGDYNHAAMMIFNLLKEVAPEGNPQADWNDISSRIWTVVSTHPQDYSLFAQQKSADYVRSFPECFPGMSADDVASHNPSSDPEGKRVPYNKYEWANSAFVSHSWIETYKSPSNLFGTTPDVTRYPYVFKKDNPDYKWLFFHIKANEQRKMIFQELGLTY
jgi:hypothetical protein